MTLLIRNVCVEDIAEYTCVAENVRTKTHLELTAEKEEKVQVESSSPAEQVCKKGQDMNFKVNLAANQLKEPTVKWMFNGKEIKSSERVSRAEGCQSNSSSRIQHLRFINSKCTLMISIFSDRYLIQPHSS